MNHLNYWFLLSSSLVSSLQSSALELSALHHYLFSASSHSLASLFHLQLLSCLQQDKNKECHNLITKNKNKNWQYIKFQKKKQNKPKASLKTWGRLNLCHTNLSKQDTIRSQFNAIPLILNKTFDIITILCSQSKHRKHRKKFYWIRNQRT